MGVSSSSPAAEAEVSKPATVQGSGVSRVSWFRDQVGPLNGFAIEPIENDPLSHPVSVDKITANIKKITDPITAIGGDTSDLRFMVLLSSGSFAPIHKMHMEMFDKAKEYLENKYYLKVVGGYLAPSSDSYVSSKLGNDFINLSARNAMCRLAVSNSDWIDVCPWGYPNGRSSRQLILDYLIEKFPTYKWEVREIYGADVVLRCCAYRNSMCTWLVLGRPSHTAELARVMEAVKNAGAEPSKIEIVPGELREVSSTAVRKAMRDNDCATLKAMLPDGVDEYVIREVRPIWLKAPEANPVPNKT
ncbi:nicotinamide mononucleotide adenylyltransferase [Pelomyxa schiedti]|nr:nicotinamide mononucleotide adenylyltransferase [Pelomyxa schiedti]